MAGCVAVGGGAGRRRWDTARAPHPGHSLRRESAAAPGRWGLAAHPSFARCVAGEQTVDLDQVVPPLSFFDVLNRQFRAHLTIVPTPQADRTVHQTHSVHGSHSQPMVSAEAASTDVDTELSEMTHSLVSQNVEASGRAANEQPPCCMCYPRDQQELVWTRSTRADRKIRMLTAAGRSCPTHFTQPC